MSAFESGWLRSLLALPVVRLLYAAVGAAIAVGLVARFLVPADYESQASVVLSVSTPQVSVFSVTAQQTSSQLVSGQLLSSLPAPAALAQAFTQRLETRAFSSLLDAEDPEKEYSARYEEKKGLLVLKATGRSREEARQRADKLVVVAQGFLQERLAAAAWTSVASALELARVDFRTGEQVLREVRELLKAAPKRENPSSPEVAAWLETMSVSPPVARSSNPAATYLKLQEAQLEAQVASARARMEALEGILKDPKTLSRLVGQALQVQVLSPPADPVRPAFPRPLQWAVTAALVMIASGAALGILLREGQGLRSSR